MANSTANGGSGCWSRLLEGKAFGVWRSAVRDAFVRREALGDFRLGLSLRGLGMAEKERAALKARKTRRCTFVIYLSLRNGSSGVDPRKIVSSVAPSALRASRSRPIRRTPNAERRMPNAKRRTHP